MRDIFEQKTVFNNAVIIRYVNILILKDYLSFILFISPESNLEWHPDNCPWGKLHPPVRVKVVVRARFSFRVGEQFSSGKFFFRTVWNVFLIEANKLHKCIEIAKIIDFQNFKFCCESHTHTHTYTHTHTHTHTPHTHIHTKEM